MDVTNFPCEKHTNKPVGGKCKRCYAEHALAKKGKERKRPYRAELTTLEKEEMARAYLLGGSTKVIAKKYSVTGESVRKVLQRQGIPLRSREEIELAQLQVLESLTGKTLRERRKESEKRSRQKVVEAIAQALHNKQCMDCGEDDIVVLQFDHRDPKTKKRDVSACSTVTSVLEEIEKCDIVCANCHTRRTQKMFGSWRIKHLPASP